MKKFLAVLVFCLPTFGQTAYSGLGLYSGSATYAASSNCAAPNFCAYNGADLIPTPTAPSFSASGTNGLQNNGVTAYDTSYLGHVNWDGSTFSNSAYLSPITRLTDAYSAPGRTYASFAAGMGGSGVFTLTNADTSLVGFDDNSLEHVCLFNTSGALKGHCSPIHSGVFITTDLCSSTNNYTCPAGSSGLTQDFGSMSFSLTDPTKLFTFGNNSYDITSPTTVCPYTITTATGAYSLGACIVDFKYGLPAYNAPNWAASTSYAYGDYVIHPLAGTEMWNGTGTWTAGVVVNTGDIVSSGGSTPCMYRAITGGTTAGSTPAFITSPPCKTDIIKESETGGGAVVWRGTNSAPQFLYQNTGASGTSGSSFIISGHPDFLSTLADGTQILWTNVGPAYLPTVGNQLWAALGGISRDTSYGGNPSKYGVAISTNSYGLSPKYSFATGQGTGIWALEYDSVTNIYHLLNTGTGIWTDYACGSGNGFTCSGIAATVIGTLTAITNPPGVGQACPFYLHNLKISSNGSYALITANPDVYPACNLLQNFLVWVASPSSFNADNSLQFTYAGLTHWAIGANKLAGFNGSGFSYSGCSAPCYSTGVFTSVYDLTAPPSSTNVTSKPYYGTLLQPYSTSCTQYNPPGCYINGGLNPVCSNPHALDSHLSWVGDPGTDTYPGCGTTYNAGTLGPAFNAWQNMETCYPTSSITPNASYPGPAGTCPTGNNQLASVGPVWQFTHTFATGASTAFSTQFQISEYSQDANWLFWSSDWDCQNGSTTGGAPSAWSSGAYYQMFLVTPVPANPSSLCGLPWAASTAYVTGNTINPIEGTDGSSAVDDVFQALADGTTGPQSTLSGNQPSCSVYVGGTLKQASCFANTNPPTITPIAITGASEAGTTGTITVSSPGLTLNIGVLVTLAGFTETDTGWNGTFAVTGTVGANCPGSTCESVTTFQLSGMPSELATPNSYFGATAAAQGDAVCDLTSPGQDSIDIGASSCTGVTWGDIGPQTQRGDVFAVNLGNQH
jgi:hypothetical protein